jgi:hypothetical protein
MKHLLSPDGQDALRRWRLGERCSPLASMERWRRSSGTEDARIPIGVRTRGPARRASPVAVISGRGLDDLVDRRSEIVYCIGNHERMVDATMRVAAHRVPWAGDATADARGPGGTQGIVLEDKGVTLSLHYRHARDRTAAAHGSVIESTDFLRRRR